jgi:hypothetical protein
LRAGQAGSDVDDLAAQRGAARDGVCGAVYQVGEGGFDDGVAAVGDVGVGERLV